LAARPAKAYQHGMSRASIRPRALLLATAVGLGVSALTPTVLAKSAHDSPYTYQQTYGSTLRLVKVDLGLKVTDQDPEWGYLLFEYTSRESGKRRSQGSFEFVKNNSGVRVSLQLASMPSYHERVIMQKLIRKLSEEHGTPPRPKPKKRKKRGKDEAERDEDGSRDGASKDQGSKRKSSRSKRSRSKRSR
jgi:hypothetical protein